MCDLRAGRVVSNFIMQALQGKPLTVSTVNELHWRGRGRRRENGDIDHLFKMGVVFGQKVARPMPNQPPPLPPPILLVLLP